ncbi:MAG: hypothetical protein KUG82_17480 [Pseudomonadales bacterium]|nr:hypothetical protein [Pseudomonadales bacterium]
MRLIANEGNTGKRVCLRHYILLLTLIPFMFGMGVETPAPVHYRLLQIPVKTHFSDQSSKSIEVRLLVSHGCGECIEFTELWRQWAAQQPGDVSLLQTHVILSAQSAVLAEAYWLGEELNILPQVIEYFGTSLSGDASPQNLETQLSAFYLQLGLTPDEIEDARQSFNVVANVREARASSEIYRIREVPAIIINGKYLTDVSSAQSYDNLLSITDLLVEKERVAQVPVNPLLTDGE